MPEERGTSAAAQTFFNNHPADSKVRLEALSSLSDLLSTGAPADLSTVCKLVASCVADNNQKASAAACALIGKLAEVAAVRPGATSSYGVSDFRDGLLAPPFQGPGTPELAVFVDPLAELIGNAKVGGSRGVASGSVGSAIMVLPSCSLKPASLPATHWIP